MTTHRHFFAPSTMGFYDLSLGAALPEDAVSISDDEYHSIFADLSQGAELVVANGLPTTKPAVQNIEQQRIGQAYLNAVDALINEQARALKYSSIVSAVSYIGDQNPQYDAEARKLRDWRSAVETAAYQILADRPPTAIDPQAIAAFIAQLPSFE